MNSPEVLPTMNRGSRSVAAICELAPRAILHARCLWCDGHFTPRATGGSAQRFCCTGHRQQFWIAARRWTMRAIEAGLLSVGCLKASPTSVHAAWGGIPTQETPSTRHRPTGLDLPARVLDRDYYDPLRRTIIAL